MRYLARSGGKVIPDQVFENISRFPQIPDEVDDFSLDAIQYFENDDLIREVVIAREGTPKLITAVTLFCFLVGRNYCCQQGNRRD